MMKEELVTSLFVYKWFLIRAGSAQHTVFTLKYSGIIMNMELKSMILSQHQRWVPDTHGESKVSVPTQQACDGLDIALSSHSFGCPLIPCHHEPEAPLLFPLPGSPPHSCRSMYLLYILHVFTTQMSPHSVCALFFFVVACVFILRGSV